MSMNRRHRAAVGAAHSDRATAGASPPACAAPRRAYSRANSRAIAAALAVAAGTLFTLPLGAQQAPSAKPTAPRASGVAPAQRSRAPVTLNFVNADIEAVTRAMAAMLGRQMLVDPRVKGQITLYSETPLSVREAYLNYLASLRGMGFTVVESAGLLKVVPEADAKLQAGTVSVDQPTVRGDQVLTQIFRLSYENPNNLVAVLRPLISPNNTINANPGNNSLVITDYADNLQRIGKIIAALDQPSVTDIEIIALKHAVASDIAPLAQRLADGGGAAAPGVPVAAGGGVSVLVDARSNSLIVRASNSAKMAQVRAVIAQLDRPSGSGGGPGGTIWVVHLKNADAVKLAAVLRAAFPTGGGGGSAAPALAAAATSPVAGGAAAATTPVAASAGPSTGGAVQADPSTNSLIITAAEPLYRQMRAVIDQLDSRRAQIFVESMIVKMDASKAAEFGFQWQNLFGEKGDRNIAGIGTNFGATGNILDLSIAAAQGTAGATAARSAVPGGLNIGLLTKVGSIYTLGALARFLETNVGANLLSTPNILVLDNEEAKIVIGQNVPFITGTFTNTGTSGGATNPFQTIERKDVGLTLRIKSQIGEGGAIRMTIFQENSSVVSAGSTAGPTTDKSSIETTVNVDDGQIMVLGGLLKDEYTDNEGKVPGLGSIPIIGNLFRSERRDRVKSNLMVFLRPVVIRNAASAETLTLDRYEQIRALQRESQPTPSIVLPIGDAPMLPPMRAPQQPAVPPPLGTSVPPSASGTSVPPSASGASVPAAPAPGASAPSKTN